MRRSSRITLPDKISPDAHNEANLETKILNTTEEDILIAAEIIKNGGIVAFPTETVYGLGANALDEAAARKVYAAKGRPSDNPMIVHISSFDDMSTLTDNITEDMKILMRELWPGPLTMVVPARDIIPKVTTGGLDTVAVRMPSGHVAARLIEAAGVPIAAPSANISGKPSPTTYQHCIDDLSGRVNAIVCGDKCQIGIESTVVDMTGDTPVILRPGIITKGTLMEILGKNVEIDPYLMVRPANMTFSAQINIETRSEAENHEKNSVILSTKYTNDKTEHMQATDFKPKSPGVKYKHYAPNAEMIIIRGESSKVKKAMTEKKHELEKLGKKVVFIEYEAEHPEIAAKDFFAALRAADDSGADVILAAALPEEGVGFAVMNRMFKSAGYNIIDV